MEREGQVVGDLLIFSLQLSLSVSNTKPFILGELKKISKGYKEGLNQAPQKGRKISTEC